jgi:Dolichyl-phosphate-mannose-protein mannosyltransferase
VPSVPSTDTSSSRLSWLTPELALRIILAMFATLTLSIAVLLPAWEANDEPDHVRNVETLVSGHWYRIAPNAGFQPHQAPLYYLALAGWQKIIGFDSWTPTLTPNPKAPAGGQYTHDDADSQRRVVALRLPSILLGILTIWLTSRIARSAGLTRWGPVAAAAIVAAIPKFVFVSSVVTNDSLAIFLGTVAILFAVKMWRSPTLRRGIALGTSCGLLLETKLTPVPLVTFLALSPFVLFAITRVRNRSAPTSEPKTQINSHAHIPFSTASVAMFFMLLVAAPLLIANQVRYGDPLASGASIEYFRSWIPALVTRNTSFSWLGISVTSGFATSFWYVSGWNQFRWKAITYVPLWMLAGIGFVGLLKKQRKRNGETSAIFLLTGAALTSASAVWILAANAMQWQARLSFPAIAAFGVLVILGYERLKIPVVLWFTLPLISLLGTLYAIRTDVVGRYFF